MAYGKYKGKSLKPGGGGAFAKLEDKLRNKKGITDPAALAATIGRKKYGAKKMGQFSAEGRQRKSTGPGLASAMRSGMK